MTRNDNTAFGTKAQPPSAKRTDAPITAHPGFPLLVAIWFAALLGIGSMVLPTALIERAATASGLASILPAANPPLGMTARILLALIAAAFGGALGFLIARKAAAQAGAALRDDRVSDLHRNESRNEIRSEPGDPAVDLPAKRPISAREELGTMTLDDPVDDSDLPGSQVLPGRRRALSVTDEIRDVETGDGETGDQKIGGQSFAIGDYGDLDKDWPSQANDDPQHYGSGSADPSAAPSPWNNGVFDPATAAAETTPQPGAEALDLADYTAPEISPSENGAFGPPGSQDISEEKAIADAGPEIPHAFDDTTEFPKESREPETVFLTGQPAQAGAAFENPARTESFADTETGGEIAGDVASDIADEMPLEAERTPDAASQTHSEPSLGQLVDRFARALQAREQANAQGTATSAQTSAFAVGRHDPFAAPAEPAQPAFSTPDAPSFDPQVPAALRPVSLELSDEDAEPDEEDASDFPDLSLALGTARKPFNPPQADASPACIATEFSSGTDSAFGNDEDQYEADDAYGGRVFASGASAADSQHDPFSSLLAMKNSAGQTREVPAIDISDQLAPHPADTDTKSGVWPKTSAPLVTPSAASPRSNAVPKAETPVPDNEQALREALEKLQRMSGAA
ncbi:hypothetical protein HME9302_02523 [Alteripontixanthobacter maritimus]|uniref:Uncharacterized protein n=1 Tax=Alteripontixanthobacter maritimus TaxID=2161824 RepID=A0A369QA08_9SPHN|nr:hypothetical protein [Alteripontixanthobacter maritimus]RDC61302.1 hypothetical protein HME9302_02523 [Alteripontixanthobacter maritimus]